MFRRLSVLLIIFFIAFSQSNCSRQKSDAKNEETAVPVQVATARIGSVEQSLTYDGDVKAEFEVKVFSKIPDRIVKFYVDEGDRVRKGEPIAEIYAATIKQAVKQAQAALAAARAQEANIRLEYQRAKRLFEEKAMSQQQFDAIKTQYEAVKAQAEQAEAALATAKSQLAEAVVKAPIGGIIGKRFYEEGDMAAPTLPLVTIVKVKRVKVVFNATEKDLGKLAVGQQARITVKSYPDEVFVGKVTKISPILDPMTRMAEVEVLVANSAKKLKPGMYANVEIITGVIKDVVVVPRMAAIENTSLVKQNGKDVVVKNYYVFVVNDDKAEQRKLDVKYVNHINLAVTSGIQAGEKLVVLGQKKLRDGLPVTIVKEGEL